MKKTKKEVKLTLIGVECYYNELSTYRYAYTFGSNEFFTSEDNLQHFIEVNEPETIKEFCEKHNMPKKEVIEWLNKNYK